MKPSWHKARGSISPNPGRERLTQRHGRLIETEFKRVETQANL